MTETLRSVHYASTDNPVPDVRLQYAECRAVANQSIPTGVVTTQTYDTTVVQTAGITQAAGVLTVAEPGVYNISYEVVFSADATGSIRQVWIEFSDSTRFYARNRWAPTALDTSVSGSVTKFLAAGQTISIRVFHDAGGAIDLVSGERDCIVTKMGAVAV